MQQVRVRFAPSPTGSPHIGNFRTAVFNWLYARHTGGRFILRIEDTDRERLVPGSMDELLYSLRWLGLDWDEGPEAGGDFGPYIQSERVEIYQQYTLQLVDKGLAYPCYCSPDRLAEMRKQQEAQKQSYGYDRRCRNLTPGQRGKFEAQCIKPVIRLAVPTEGSTSFYDEVRRDQVTWENRLLDDFVMLKSDGFPTYHLANVVDDHLMQITHVIRAEEWISSTPKHVLLYNAFGWQQPKWVHAPILLGEDRSKLSKRSGTAVAFSEYMKIGCLPDALLNFLAIMGWSAGEDREIYTREELIEKFDISGIASHAAVFDIQKLQWMNGEYIRSMPVADLAKQIMPFLQEAGFIVQSPSEADIEYVRSVTALIQERIKLLSEAAEASRFFFGDMCKYEPKAIEKSLSKPGTKALLDAVADKLESVKHWDLESIESAIREAGASMGAEGGKIIHPVRAAVTGRTSGPGLFECIQVLGKERSVLRLRQAPAEN